MLKNLLAQNSDAYPAEANPIRNLIYAMRKNHREHLKLTASC